MHIIVSRSNVLGLEIHVNYSLRGLQVLDSECKLNITFMQSGQLAGHHPRFHFMKNNGYIS